MTKTIQEHKKIVKNHVMKKKKIFNYGYAEFDMLEKHNVILMLIKMVEAYDKLLGNYIDLYGLVSLEKRRDSLKKK